MNELDFSTYENTLPYANYKTDRSAFDAWANRNDYLVQEFTIDVVQYMNKDLVANGGDNKVKINTLTKIADVAINQKKTPKEQFDLCMEILNIIR